MQVIDTGKASAEENMALDVAYLESLEAPLLHLYDWATPSITYGHFIDPSKYLCLKALEQRGIGAARRPTGGGITLHMTDYAFSILIPASHPMFSLNPLENYISINRLVMGAIREFIDDEINLALLHLEIDNGANFCMAKGTKYDIMLNGAKVGGAAQRRTKKGFLHQGSILLSAPDRDLLDHILLEKRIVDLMEKNSLPLLGKGCSSNFLLKEKERLKECLKESVIRTIAS